MKKFIIAVIIFSVLAAAAFALYNLNYIPHKEYTNSDFNITPYISQTDMDGDGIDDQTDILNSVRAYLETKPVYKSKYYDTGYPDDEHGVCTDVTAFGLLGAGYDLMELVNEDILNEPDEYGIDSPDKNIDFRRVSNLKVYFKRHAIHLTTDIKDISEWHGGDIVIFNNHIGIVSDKRNKNGIPFLIHHKGPQQKYYEEDVLQWYKIYAHYRVS